jgi:hypothetical protein
MGAVSLRAYGGGLVLSGPLAFAQEDLTREGARAAAERELAKRIYHLDDPSWLERLIGAVLSWLGELIGAAVDVTVGGAGGLLLLGLVILALVTAARLGFGPLRARDFLTDRRSGARTRTAADYRAEAESSAQRGAWRDAVRARFRAVVRELEERGVIDPRPGRTAGEVAREGGAAVPVIATQLRAAADVFDEIWYGDRPAGEPAYRRLAEVDDTIRTTRLTGAPVGTP